MLKLSKTLSYRTHTLLVTIVVPWCDRIPESLLISKYNSVSTNECPLFFILFPIVPRSGIDHSTRHVYKIKFLDSTDGHVFLYPACFTINKDLHSHTLSQTIPFPLCSQIYITLRHHKRYALDMRVHILHQLAHFISFIYFLNNVFKVFAQVKL